MVVPANVTTTLVPLVLQPVLLTSKNTLLSLNTVLENSRLPVRGERGFLDAGSTMKCQLVQSAGDITMP